MYLQWEWDAFEGEWDVFGGEQVKPLLLTIKLNYINLHKSQAHAWMLLVVCILLFAGELAFVEVFDCPFSIGGCVFLETSFVVKDSISTSSRNSWRSL